jgi:hypothetical protein
VPAGLYSDAELRPKTPPIMFDRAADGSIVLPGRWWQLTFEKLSQDDRAPAEVRHGARQLASLGAFADARLPADTDTISFFATDDSGELVEHEALAPGTPAMIRLEPLK